MVLIIKENIDDWVIKKEILYFEFVGKKKVVEEVIVFEIFSRIFVGVIEECKKIKVISWIVLLWL